MKWMNAPTFFQRLDSRMKLMTSSTETFHGGSLPERFAKHHVNISFEQFWFWKKIKVNTSTYLSACSDRLQKQHYSKEMFTWCYRKPLFSQTSSSITFGFTKNTTYDEVVSILPNLMQIFIYYQLVIHFIFLFANTTEKYNFRIWSLRTSVIV